MEKIFLLLIIGMIFVSCQDPISQVESVDSNIKSRNVSMYKPKPVNAKGKGFYWFEKNGKLFDPTRPTIVFIHGASGAPQFTNLYWESSRFNGWNVAVFNWSDRNTPLGAYQEKSSQLYEELTKFITQSNYNNNEIRLTAYSWGVHVASYAGRKLIDKIKESERKILLTVDLLDPVLVAGIQKDNDDITKFGFKHVRDNLGYIANNQVVGIKEGKKLFTWLIEKNYNGVFMLKEVLPYVNKHVEVHQNGVTHCVFDICPTHMYKECEWKDYDDLKIDLNEKVYSHGEVKVKKDWVLAKSYYKPAHGPIFRSSWRYDTHDCTRFVDVQKEIPYKYWGQTGTKKVTNGGYWKNGVWHWNYKTVPTYGWIDGTKTETVKELKEFKNDIDCGISGTPHQKYFHEIWHGFQSRYF